jgi:hypothetical protein
MHETILDAYGEPVIMESIFNTLKNLYSLPGINKEIQ